MAGKQIGTWAFVVALALGGVGLTGCEQESGNNLQDTGQNLRDAGENAGDAVRGAGQDVRDAAEGAAEGN